MCRDVFRECSIGGREERGRYIETGAQTDINRDTDRQTDGERQRQREGGERQRGGGGERERERERERYSLKSRF